MKLKLPQECVEFLAKIGITDLECSQNNIYDNIIDKLVSHLMEHGWEEYGEKVNATGQMCERIIDLIEEQCEKLL